MTPNPSIFREYDIRGVYPKHFDDAHVFQLGRSIARYFKSRGLKQKNYITIGYDARHSSTPIKNALIAGFQSEEVQTRLLGLVTTPISYFTLFLKDDPASGSVMITGSHNPPEYNGFKICWGRESVFGLEIQAIKKIFYETATSFTNVVQFPPSEPDQEFRKRVLDAYVSMYHRDFCFRNPLSAVFDCGNGTSGMIARKLFQIPNLTSTFLFEEPDGRFPNHHPDPTVEANLTSLKSKVKELDADWGIGFDGDADRLGVIDREGNVIWGDELLYLLSVPILKKEKQKIIFDVKCSDRLPRLIEELQGEPIMWKTGHALIKKKVKDEDAPLGGELSGHIFFKDRNFGFDDALYAALRFLEMVDQYRQELPSLRERWVKTYITPEIRIDVDESELIPTFEKIKDAALNLTKTSDYFKNFSVSELDGYRISWFSVGWLLVRLSNTQPVIVVRFETTKKEPFDIIGNTLRSVIPAIADHLK